MGILCNSLEGTNKYQRYYLKDGCGAGDDIRTGVSSDDKETGRQLEVTRNENAEVFPGSDNEEKY